MNLKNIESQVVKRFVFVWGFILIGYVFYRGFTLSLTHDEVGTSNLLFETIRDTMFHPNCFQSANNHILNSILMKLSVSIFGQSAWAMRMPNMLAFVLYYMSVVLALKVLIRTPWIFILALIAMTTNLYVLDFFSLCRGYGLALAFQMMSISYFVQFLYSNTIPHVGVSFLWAALAIYANFTWFNYYAALYVCLCLWFLYDWRKDASGLFTYLKALVLPSLIFMAIYALSAIPLGYLKQMDEFRWGANGWFDFLFTFCGNLIYQTHKEWSIAMEVLVLLSYVVSCVAYFKWYGFQKINKPYLFLLLLIFIIVLETIVQRNLLNIQYMDGRKAIMYVPLFTLLLFVFMQRFFESFKVPTYTVAAVLSFFILFNLKSANLKLVREWYYDYNSKNIAYQLDSQLKEGKTIGVYWWYYPSISYYTKFELKQNLQQIVRIEDSEKTYGQDYLYLNPDKSPQSGYERISMDGVGNSLWKRLP